MRTDRPRYGAPRWLVAAAVGARLWAPEGAQAAAPTENMRLSWERGAGTESCLDQDELSARVSKRLGRDPFSANALLEIHGRVTRSSDRFRVEIGVRDQGGKSVGQRVIETAASDCGPLGDAIVLAVALTIDPDARIDGSENDAPVTSPSGADRPFRPAPPRPTPSPLSPVEDRGPSPAAVPQKRGLEVSGVARGILGFGVLPGAAPGAEIEALAGGGRFHGSLGLSLLPEKATDDSRFALGLTFATAAVCYDPVGRKIARLRLCAGVQAGAIHSLVRGALLPANPGDQLWLAAAVTPRFVWTGWSPVIVDAGVSLAIPLIRREFGLVGQAEPSYREAAFGVLGSVGVGLGAF